MTYMTLAEVAELLGAELHGDPDTSIAKLATLESAGDHSVAFLANRKYRQQLENTRATAVLVADKDRPYCKTNALVVPDPYVAFAKLAQHLETAPAPAQGIHPTAVIDPSVKLGKEVSIGAYTVIEAGAEIGDGTILGAQCYIGHNTRIGNACVFWAKVTVYHHVVIGDQCRVHSATVIGADGFGYANDKGRWERIPQSGRVVIGNRVEIGASTTIDRGALDDTVIEDNVIIDNQCQIAHNCRVGTGTAMSGASSLAGSATVGSYCIIGGGTGVNGHIKVADGAQFTGMSMVVKAEAPGLYSSGIPAMPNREWRRSIARFQQLESMHKQMKQMQQELDSLKAQLADPSADD